MVRLGRFTKEELRILDDKSTENMLIYYEKEMRLINEGATASELITRPLIHRFVEIGFLELGRECGRCKTMLSRKGRVIYGLP